MYNGIGLQTARGSGTNGHVQRNWATVRPFKDKVKYRSEEEIAKLEASSNRQPNRGILDHERKRKIEVKCTELEDLLEEQGLSRADIIVKVMEFRTKMTMLDEPAPMPQDDFGRVAARNTHEIAEAQQAKNARLREAFGISEYFVEGSSFDPARRAKEELAKAADLQITRRREEQEGRHLEQGAGEGRSNTPPGRRENGDGKEGASGEVKDAGTPEVPGKKKRKRDSVSSKHDKKKKSKKRKHDRSVSRVKKSKDKKKKTKKAHKDSSSSGSSSSDSESESEPEISKKKKKVKKSKKKRSAKKKHVSESDDSSDSSSETEKSRVKSANKKVKSNENVASKSIKDDSIKISDKSRKLPNEVKSRLDHENDKELLKKESRNKRSLSRSGRSRSRNRNRRRSRSNQKRSISCENESGKPREYGRKQRSRSRENWAATNRDDVRRKRTRTPEIRRRRSESRDNAARKLRSASRDVGRKQRRSKSLDIKKRRSVSPNKEKKGDKKRHQRSVTPDMKISKKNRSSSSSDSSDSDNDKRTISKKKNLSPSANKRRAPMRSHEAKKEKNTSVSPNRIRKAHPRSDSESSENEMKHLETRQRGFKKKTSSPDVLEMKNSKSRDNKKERSVSPVKKDRSPTISDSSEDDKNDRVRKNFGKEKSAKTNILENKKHPSRSSSRVRRNISKSPAHSPIVSRKQDRPLSKEKTRDKKIEDRSPARDNIKRDRSKLQEDNRKRSESPANVFKQRSSSRDRINNKAFVDESKIKYSESPASLRKHSESPPPAIVPDATRKDRLRSIDIKRNRSRSADNRRNRSRSRDRRNSSHSRDNRRHRSRSRDYANRRNRSRTPRRRYRSRSRDRRNRSRTPRRNRSPRDSYNYRRNLRSRSREFRRNRSRSRDDRRKRGASASRSDFRRGKDVKSDSRDRILENEEHRRKYFAMKEAGGISHTPEKQQKDQRDSRTPAKLIEDVLEDVTRREHLSKIPTPNECISKTDDKVVKTIKRKARSRSDSRSNKLMPVVRLRSSDEDSDSDEGENNKDKDMNVDEDREKEIRILRLLKSDLAAKTKERLEKERCERLPVKKESENLLSAFAKDIPAETIERRSKFDENDKLLSTNDGDVVNQSIVKQELLSDVKLPSKSYEKTVMDCDKSRNISLSAISPKDTKPLIVTENAVGMGLATKPVQRTSRSSSRSSMRSRKRHSSSSSNRSSKSRKSKSRSRSRSSRSSSSDSSSSSSSSTSMSSRSSRSRSKSRSSKARSRSRSPSIPRRHGSPSFLDRRRITSKEKVVHR